MKQPAAAGESLPRELTDFLVDLANAIAKHGMYPDGHPVLLTVADTLARSLSLIFRDRAAIALGISPTQIIVAGIATDPGQILLRDLASRLHRRNIGAIKLYRGVEPAEMVDLMRVVARDSATASDGAPTERRWPHIRMHPVSYSQLELIGDAGEGRATSWATGQWMTLAVAALESDSETENVATPAALAQAIDARHGDDEYGQRIAGQLTDLLDACRARGGSEAIALQSQISRLIGSMAPETLERLVSLEPNEAERKRFLLEMSQAMAVDAVLDLVQAAARATSRSISPALVQLLGKMANYAQEEDSDVRVKAELAFRQQVRSLIEGWDDWSEKDPAPDEYQRTLNQLAAAGKNPLRGPSHHYECEPERTLQLSLEVGLATDATRDAAARLLEAAKLKSLLDTLDRSPNYGLAAELRHQVITADSLGRALQKRPVDFSAITTMVELVGAPALPLLLDQLMVAMDDPETLRQFVTLLKGMGDGVGEAVLERLAGAPWPVQRNLLTLLAALPAIPAGFSPAEFTRNSDPSIRGTALRILLGGSATRGRAICDALAGQDTPTVRLGIAAAVEGCPPAAVPLLIQQIEHGDFEPGVKAAAIRAIAPVHLPLVVDFLVGLSTTRTLWLRRKRLAHRSPQVLAAVTGLSRHWGQNPRAREVLEMARAHGEAEFRAAATGSSA